MTEQQVPTTPQEKRAYWQQHIYQWQKADCARLNIAAVTESKSISGVTGKNVNLIKST